MFTAVSESRTAAVSHRFEYVQVWNLFKNVHKLFRSFNSGMMECVNIPVLVCCAGASGIGTEVAGAAGPLLSMICSNPVKSSSLKFAV